MAKPLTDAERQEIVQLIEQGLARNEIARQTGRSLGTITNVANEHGLTFDRSATKTACEARVVDLAKRRADLMAALVEDAHKLRRQLWEPCVEKKVVTLSGGMHGVSTWEVVEVEHEQPPFADQQRILTSVGIATDKALAIDKHDNRNDEGLAAVDSWLRDIIGEAA